MSPITTPVGGTTVPGGFGLYVHWPFCRHKCPYCDFNSHVTPTPPDHDRWRRALLAELDHAGAATRGRRLQSIFFGGGTPSLMAPETVAALLERACHWWHPAPDLEVTLEANPTSLEARKLRDFAAAGINRVSLGVQALEDDALRFLGREHTAREALEALELAATTVDRWSFDLIYGRPGQSLDAWQKELEHTRPYLGGHVSAYQLTIEPGTRFHALAQRGELVMPDDDRLADFYETTRAYFRKQGLDAYEISNHARPGEACRHNLVYWRYGEYAGIGPGAHGRLTLERTRIATSTRRAPQAWLTAVESHGHSILERQTLSPFDQAAEMILMGLRLREGLDLDRLAGLLGTTCAELLAGRECQSLIEDGWLEVQASKLRATEPGRLRLNAITSQLVEALPLNPDNQWMSSASPHAA